MRIKVIVAQVTVSQSTMRNALHLLALLFTFAFGTPTAAQEAGNSPREGGSSVSVYLFWTASCPHCAKARQYLTRFAAREPEVHLHSFELNGDTRHERVFIALSQRFQVEPLAVPLILIGEKLFVGYGEDATSGLEIEAEVKRCLAVACRDVAGPIVAQAQTREEPDPTRTDTGTGEVRRPALLETIWLPGLGNVATRSLSLPVLTIVLGAVASLASTPSSSRRLSPTTKANLPRSRASDRRPLPRERRLRGRRSVLQQETCDVASIGIGNRKEWALSPKPSGCGGPG